MIVCVDVYYGNTLAYAAGVAFRAWPDSEAAQERVIPVARIHDYQPGQFFRRELPCLLAVLREFPLVDVVIVDGYVWLDGLNRPGLGARLYQAMERRVAVIGVAKTKFRGADLACEVKRGKSSRPLFITAAGISQETAAECIAAMYGAYRIPTLLQRVDYLCRHAQLSNAQL